MPRKVFHDFLSKNNSFDFVLIQTVMTYWTPGYREVIEDVRQYCPNAKIILGGFYATACNDHAKSLGADAVIAGDDCGMAFQAMFHGLEDRATKSQPPAWDHGCPFKCSYCYVPQSGQPFKARPLNECLAELKHLVNLGAKNIAFYDDALLYQPEQIILPFLLHHTGIGGVNGASGI
jgi:radical SAM superfamily enzyme YgiQ (UPF0313 family)